MKTINHVVRSNLNQLQAKPCVTKCCRFIKICHLSNKKIAISKKIYQIEVFLLVFSPSRMNGKKRIGEDEQEFSNTIFPNGHKTIPNNHNIEDFYLLQFCGRRDYPVVASGRLLSSHGK